MSDSRRPDDGESTADVTHPDGHLLEVPVPRPKVLGEVLAESRARGLVGPADLGVQVRHSLAFARRLAGARRVADLGSGGGLPGLVLLEARPDMEVVLIDSAARRCRFLEWAVARLGAGERAAVVHGRAEDVARMDGFRETFDAVTARSFGPPAVTAECGRGLLRPGGRLVVSDPPGGGGERWDPDGLEDLGLARVVDGDPGDAPGTSVHLTVLEAIDRCPERVPRRSGVPSRRPLF